MALDEQCRGVRTGVAKLLRAGDVVWDIALGDDGNVGRIVWNGGYLVVCHSYPILGIQRGGRVLT